MLNHVELLSPTFANDLAGLLLSTDLFHVGRGFAIFLGFPSTKMGGRSEQHRRRAKRTTLRKHLRKQERRFLPNYISEL